MTERLGETEKARSFQRDVGIVTICVGLMLIVVPVILDVPLYHFNIQIFIIAVGVTMFFKLKTACIVWSAGFFLLGMTAVFCIPYKPEFLLGFLPLIFTIDHWKLLEPSSEDLKLLPSRSEVARVIAPHCVLYGLLLFSFCSAEAICNYTPLLEGLGGSLGFLGEILMDLSSSVRPGVNLVISIAFGVLLIYLDAKLYISLCSKHRKQLAVNCAKYITIVLTALIVCHLLMTARWLYTLIIIYSRR